jgi:hypothetical protein
VLAAWCLKNSQARKGGTRIFAREYHYILKDFDFNFLFRQKMRAAHRETNPEPLAKRQRKAVGNNDREYSYPLLFCLVINAMKRQLTNRLSEIPKLNFFRV